MYGNYYCVHAIFVEKTDGTQKKSVSLGMGVIRINIIENLTKWNAQKTWAICTFPL